MTGDFEIGRMLAVAGEQMDRGNLRGALEILRRLLANDPGEARAHALLSLCLRDLKRLHAARHEAQMALALEPELWTAHYALAMVHLAEGRRREALMKIEHALALEPEHAALLRAKAVIQRALGRVEAARASLDQALSLDAGDPATLVALGTLELDAGRVDAAARLAREALEQAPESVDALVLQGRVLLRRGQIDDAREHALWALRANSADSEALRFLVEVKVRQNPLLGLWWRYATFMSSLGDRRQILFLTLAFGAFRVLVLVAKDLQAPGAAQILEIAWLALAVYSWIGPAVFQRMLKREMGEVVLRPDF